MSSRAQIEVDDSDPAASGLARLDAIRLRLVESIESEPVAESAARAVRRATAAVTALGDVDLAELDAIEMRAWLEGVEELRRSIEATAVAAAGAVDRRNPFRGQGFFSAKTVIKHMCRLSGPEAHRRVQTARLHEALPAWATAEADGHVGVAQCELMARIAANPRIESAVLERDAPALLDDAIEQSFAEFERRARTWEALADPAGDLANNERHNAARDFMLRPRPEGGWTLTGNLAELAGVEFMEIFSWFVEAEWHTDWAEARQRLGDNATTTNLVRTEAQRRADALIAVARAAASTPPGSQQPRPTVNVPIDQESFEAHLRGDTPDPRRYRDVVIRTQSGRRLHPDDAINTALIGHIRRVVYDASGTVIDLGRRSRLFRGSSRDAVMVLLTTCVWIGCDRPIAWCDADHSLGWKAHGATVPRNGGALCQGHNHLKEHGFGVLRDDNGDWHVIDPDGNEIT
ncbi:MAG TPA: DUF222 domain-containing protein [Ilumatobacteraceae bacterium]|nr:DUF222 domain-containing protein [Ilumatobacteraceae bacterium]